MVVVVGGGGGGGVMTWLERETEELHREGTRKGGRVKQYSGGQTVG